MRFEGTKLTRARCILTSLYCSTLTEQPRSLARGLHTGREIDLDIEPNDKVARIKERVEEKEGIPPAQQRLIFGGKQM